MLENNLSEMFANVSDVLGTSTVISAAVTNRIKQLQSMSLDDIMTAGKSGLGKNKGILVNAYNLFFSDGYTGKMLGKVGLSGFAGNNPECIKRALLGYGICQHCFSFLTP